MLPWAASSAWSLRRPAAPYRSRSSRVRTSCIADGLRDDRRRNNKSKVRRNQRMTPKLEQLAQDLAEAWRSGGTVPLPRADSAPAARSEAYAVQDRMAELIGGRGAGWEVRATV